MVFVQGIPKGNSMEMTVTFTDVIGAPFDPPTGIEIRVVDGEGDLTVYTYPPDLTRVSEGTYRIQVVAVNEGDWVAKGVGVMANGQPVTTEDVVQPVLPSRVP